jgi:hypothetical protein
MNKKTIGLADRFMRIRATTEIRDAVAGLLPYIAFPASMGLFFAPLPTYAASVTLAWDPSSDPTVIGYTIQYGNSNGSNSQSMDAGSSNSATIAGLSPGTTYLFVVTAYDAGGLQSAPSNQVSFEPNFTPATGPFQHDFNWSQWVITYLEAGQQLVNAFVRDANGHLDVNYWNGSAWQWADQGVPPGTTASGSPAVITDLTGDIYAFETGADGHLYVNYSYSGGSGWQWADQGVPPGTTASGSTAVITNLAGDIYAFVTGANGHLYVDYWDGLAWQWADQGVPPGTTASGSPAVITYLATNIYAFVTGADGHLYVNYSYSGGSGWQWADHGVPPTATASGNPAVITYLATNIYAFVTGADGHLYVNYCSGGLGW